MAIREEFNYIHCKDYLYGKIDLLIAGHPSDEERSHFFFDEWEKLNKDVLLLCQNDEVVRADYYAEGQKKDSWSLDLTIGLPQVLNHLDGTNKNILVELSSLSHVLIMYLTKILIKHIVPRTLFASYIRPHKYKTSEEKYIFNLTDRILGVSSVPGFVKRERDDELLCSFIGFEGVRLRSIIESMNNIESLIPIVAFPSTILHWYNVTIWNCMDLLNENTLDYGIYKCFSESIFEAVDLLHSIIPHEKNVVVAPIGTRPHSMASAIYATQNQNARMIYDYAIENTDRAEGIGEISIYHLTSFLSV